MKTTTLLLLTLLFTLTLFAQNQANYLIKMNRKAVYEHYSVSNLQDLVKSLPAQISIYHSSANYLLAGTDETSIKQLPSSSYALLDQFPLSGNWYLLSEYKNKRYTPKAAVGEEITRLDQSILIKSNLSDTELARETDLPYVRMDFTPLVISESRLMNFSQANRVDFGNILNQVNADSIAWFIQHLQNFGTRYFAANNKYLVASWIRSQFQRFGYTDTELDNFFVQETNEQWDAVATLPGTVNPEKYIVIGGHHDSIVFDDNDPMITAPGADDNASGTAAVLEIARVMKACNYQPDCTIKFATFAAEEIGLWGSKHLAQSALEDQLNIKLMVNHDMISTATFPPGEWYVLMNPYEGYEGYTGYAVNVIDAQTTLNPLINLAMNSASSDSYSFWQRGFPVIYFDEAEFSPYYHSINDIFSNINIPYAKEVIKASAAVAVSFDQNPSPIASVNVEDTGTGNTLSLNWTNAGLENDVTSYKIYVTPDVNVTPLAYTSSTTSFIVPNLTDGVLYYIAVAAVDNHGNEGIARVVSGTPYSIPQIPVGFNDMPNLHMIVINWSANQELDIAGYRLYRSLSPDGPFTLLNSTLLTSTSYTDEAITDLTYYYYKLTAVDTNNNGSEPTEILRSRGLTLNQGILIIDETRNNTGNNVFSPNDIISDQFYTTVLHDYHKTQFDIETDGTLKLADIGIYSSILWHGNDFSAMTYPHLVRDEIAKYIQAGGKILISSYFPTEAFDSNTEYPITYTHNAFMYDNLGVQTASFDNRARFKYGIPGGGAYPALEVDTLKTIAPMVGHIYNVQSVGASSSAQNIYTYGSDYEQTATQGIMNGLPVGIYAEPGLGKSILLSFPLYNLYADGVTNLMHYVFGELFGEPVVNQDYSETPPAILTISKAYPNPFYSSVNLEIRQPKSNMPLTVSVYNAKGQKVKTLFSGVSKSTTQALAWDGKDKTGNTAAASIYFVKAMQGSKIISRKIIKLN